MRYIFLTLLVISCNTLMGQDLFNQLKTNYDRFRKEKKQDSALMIAKQMNVWALQAESDSSLKYAVSFRYIGNCFYSLNSFDSANYFYSLSVKILKKQNRQNHTEFAYVLMNYATILKIKLDFNTAEKLYLEAKKILNNAFGEKNTEYIRCYNLLGVLYQGMGDYYKAIENFKQLLIIEKKNYGEFDPNYAQTLDDLASNYRIIGEFNLSNLFYKQALDIRSKTLGQKSKEYAYSLNNLGALCFSIGDYKSSGELTKKSLEILKYAIGEETLDYATALYGSGLISIKLENLIEAEYFLKQSSEIKKRILGEEHPDYARILYGLGEMFEKKGDYKAAENYYIKTIEIYKKTIGETHPDYADVLYSLASLFNRTKKYSKAENYISLASPIYLMKKGKEYPGYIYCNYLLVNIYFKTDRIQPAFNILKENLTSAYFLINNNFEWMSDKQKKDYFDEEQVLFEKIHYFANSTFEHLPEVVELSYNSLLFSKSLLLENTINSENIDREIEELKEKLARNRKLLIRMQSNGFGNDNLEENLRHETDSLDNLLTLSSTSYAQQKKNLSITWDQIQQNIDNDEAAIEFVRYKNEDDSLYYYNALIIRKSDKYPVLVQLCPEKKLLNKQPQFDFDSYYKLVWQPMEAYLKDIKTIYYSPVGELNNLPFHAFKTENDDYLMDRYSLHQLTSTRYLAMGLKQKEKESIPLSITLVGGVNYDYLLNTNSELAINNKKNKSSRSGPDAKKLDYLAGTKKEVENINTTLKSLKWSTTVFENNDATEENIMKLEGKEAKGILHISTHGYAFPEFNFIDSTIDKNSLKYSYRYSQNPMVRSGLILTGGNWAWMGSDTLTKLGAEQNGILTALEVSQLNLRKTKLVVLSACETGLGKIEGSEGTFGLKRAFKLAGVENLIVSLWSVPDDQTMELMTIFYTDLAQTLNPVMSFAKAQKDMRNKYPYQPGLWAGFVLVR